MTDSPQSLKTGAGRSPLGIYAKSITPPFLEGSERAVIQKNRAERYELLSVARRVFSAAGKRAGLVYGHDYCKTAKCRYISHGQAVAVHKSKLHKSAFYSGLVTCGRVWDCPVCGPKIQERRREEIAKAVKWAYDKGLQPVMVTLTFPHYSWNKLSVLLKQQAFALQRLRAGAPWKRFKEAVGYEGLIRSLENLFGLNGWHPHTHELWFVRGDANAEAMKAEVLKRWESACIRAGLLDPKNQSQLEAFRAHSVDVKGNCSASDYLAKQDDSRHWGVDREVAKGSTKKGRAKGLHPFALLAKAGEGDKRSERLYLAYCMAMKGKSQLYWSQGLKDAVGLNEATDEQLAEESMDVADLLGTLTLDDWKLVRAASMRAQLLDAAESGGWSAIHEILASLRKGKEMGQAKARGTREERIAQAVQMNQPEQFFGYNRERRPDESPFEISEDGLVCMVARITPENLEAAIRETGKDFKPGQWFCSTGAHSETVVHGPFDTSDSAFSFAHDNHGVVRFMSSPQ